MTNCFTGLGFDGIEFVNFYGGVCCCCDKHCNESKAQDGNCRETFDLIITISFFRLTCFVHASILTSGTRGYIGDCCCS